MQSSDTLDDMISEVKKKRGFKVNDPLCFDLYHWNAECIVDGKTSPEKRKEEMGRIFATNDLAKPVKILMQYTAQAGSFTSKNSVKLWNAHHEILYFDVEYDVDGSMVDK